MPDDKKKRKRGILSAGPPVVMVRMRGALLGGRGEQGFDKKPWSWSGSGIPSKTLVGRNSQAAGISAQPGGGRVVVEAGRLVSGTGREEVGHGSARRQPKMQ